jgi:GT2 family glycosyltransferase
MENIQISIIIPNFNGKQFLRECLNSIKKQNFSLYEVIIIDNGSTDGSVEYLNENYPEFALIQNQDNLGFATAVNQGIKISNAEYVFLLNNDTELEDDCLSNLLNCIQDDETLFAVSSKMIQNQDRDLIDDAGDEYTILGFTKKVGNNRSSEQYQNKREIFSACAGAALYRRSIFDIIGYFDENFFAYMEDVDISYRARIYGFKSVYCPEAIVYHYVSATSRSKYNTFKIRLAARNNVYVPYKNMPWPQLALNLLFLILGFLIKYLVFLKKGHGNDYMAGLKDGLTSLDKIDRIRYKKGRFSNYLSIEWLLIKNTLKIIYL